MQRKLQHKYRHVYSSDIWKSMVEQIEMWAKYMAILKDLCYIQEMAAGEVRTALHASYHGAALYHTRPGLALWPGGRAAKGRQLHRLLFAGYLSVWYWDHETLTKQNDDGQRDWLFERLQDVTIRERWSWFANLVMAGNGFINLSRRMTWNWLCVMVED